MIDPNTGEVGFQSGLRIRCHDLISTIVQSLPPDGVASRSLPVEGWQQHHLGEHASPFGTFAVAATEGTKQRVEAVFLSHVHSFYDTPSPDDSERRIFHEGVIASDLRGQREFPWGHVFCRLDPQAMRDWLVVIYSPFSNVPLQEREIYRMLWAHEEDPDRLP